MKNPVLARCGRLSLLAFALTVQLPISALAAGDFAPATTATNQLGLELFRQIAGTSAGGNVLLSPFSIQEALAMTYAGAEGDTRAEMARVLHFPADDAPLAASFGVLRDALDATAAATAVTAANRVRAGGKLDVIEWHLANRLFGQDGYEFREPFLAIAKSSYGAPLEVLDFKTAADPARVKINTWVADQTKQKIRDLIPAGGLDKDTRLVLVNALYLKAPWAEPFVADATEARPFQARGAAAVNVPTMQLTKPFGYAKREGFTAVTLPYLGGDLQLLILLPDTPTGVDALAAQLTPAMLSECAKLPVMPVALELPKFRLEPPTIALGKLLQALGMKTAFNLPKGSANFDRMAPRRLDDYLYLSEIYHKTFLALDESGTEAAAATAVAMMRATAIRANPPQPVVVKVNHPFLFAIQHRESGVCLYLGRVEDPR